MLIAAAAMTGVVAAPQSASAASGTTLYVNNTDSSCTDSGTGTQAVPYCSVQAAANAATAGDTVMIGGGLESYSKASLTISRSGTATAPITFEPAQGRYFNIIGGMVVSGSYIDIEGMQDMSSLNVTGSHVTLDRNFIDGETAAAIATGSGVTGLTVERSIITNLGDGPGITLGANNSDTVLSTNAMRAEIELNGDTNTVITSNTLSTGCDGVSIVGSTGTVVENNIIDASCYGGQVGTALTVDARSATSTTEGYNVLPNVSSPYSTVGDAVVPYSWSGTTYTTQSAFAAASGQGAADVVEASLDLGTSSTTVDSAAVGSANASAPDELSADIFGNPWGSTPDRGAVHFAEFSGATLEAQSTSPQQVEIGLDLQGAAWGPITESYDWGDGTTSSAGDPDTIESQYSDFSEMDAQTHMYAKRGTYTITETLTDASQTITRTATVTTYGGTFASVVPTRVLDTRKGIGAAQAQVKPNSSVSFDVTKGVALPAGLGTIMAVVMNVTVTDATANGFVTAYPTGGAVPKSSNVNFLAHQNIPNLVTVAVGAGNSVSLLNSSGGSSDLIADVEGYYVDSASGGYYLPNTPKRVLDTRNGTGGAKVPVAAGASVSISVPQCTSGSGASAVSATATAVAANVTVVSPTANGVITAYPDQGAVPAASNLNYRTGQTVPNLVVVKVGADGKVDFKNSSTGTTQLIVDLEGCYSATLGSAFVPVAPYRALDTRSGLGEIPVVGTPAPANGDVNWWDEDEAFGGLTGMTGAVMNITAVQSQANGVLTAYPSAGTVPTASNVNYSTGQTAANLAMVAADQDGISIYNNSKGKVQVLVDVFGYFS